MSRWVKIYDDLLNWRWAHKPEYVSFAVHCILRANTMPWKWEKYDFPLGSFVTSMERFADEVGITVKQYRTILKNLQDCGFLEAKTTNKFTLITICNYGSYQENKNKKGKQTANEGQPDGNRSANEGQPDGKQVATDIDINNNNITDFKDNKNKEFFLKGGKAEKKIFENLEDLKKILNENKIYMTEQGYKEFKELNENPDGGYGYRGGVVQSARNFLKNPKNAQYRKNPPPPPRPQQKPPDQAALKAASEMWERVKKVLEEEMMPQSFKTWILPIVPLKLESGTLKIQVPSQYFRDYLEENYIQQLRKALNENKIEKLIYSIII